MWSVRGIWWHYVGMVKDGWRLEDVWRCVVCGSTFWNFFPSVFLLFEESEVRNVRTSKRRKWSDICISCISCWACAACVGSTDLAWKPRRRLESIRRCHVISIDFLIRFIDCIAYIFALLCCFLMLQQFQGQDWFHCHWHVSQQSYKSPCKTINIQKTSRPKAVIWKFKVQVLSHWKLFESRYASNLQTVF